MSANQTTDFWQTVLHNTVGNDSQWFWAMVQAVGVIVTLWFIVRQLKLQRLANVLSSLTALNTRWESKEMVDARKIICKAHLDGKDCGVKSTIAIAGFFEELGLYVEKSIIEEEIVWELYGEYTEHYWPILLQRMKEAQTWDESGYCFFKKLHKRCVKLSAKADPKTAERSQEDLKVFAESELKSK